MTTYRTTDLHCSSYLVTQGHHLLRVEGSPRESEFVFQGSAQLAQDVAAFYGNTATVRALDLFRSFKQLRRRLY